MDYKIIVPPEVPTDATPMELSGPQRAALRTADALRDQVVNCVRCKGTHSSAFGPVPIIVAGDAGYAVTHIGACPNTGEALGLSQEVPVEAPPPGAPARAAAPAPLHPSSSE